MGIAITILVLLLTPFYLESKADETPAPVEPSEVVEKFDIDKTIRSFAVAYEIDEVLARRIIQCESQFNPYAIGVKAVVGTDIGLFQINTHYHEETMNSMGLDIYDPEDNLKYGFMLLEKDGVRHWHASRSCWS